MRDLYAYLMTRPAVKRHGSEQHDSVSVEHSGFGRRMEDPVLPEAGVFSPNTAKSAEWNRGAYLAEILSDCTGCHTPRNALGGEKSKRAYGSDVVEGWIAPALTEANPSPVPWTLDDFYTYLRTGVSRLHVQPTRP